MHVSGVARSCAEWKFISQKIRKDPWGETSLIVHITSSDKKRQAVPAFWAGGQEWRVRFTPEKKGNYTFITECADLSDKGLHGIQGTIKVAAAGNSDNVFIKHGAVRMAAGGKGFEHQDKTPFFWFADTWWMLMTGRVSWPDGFRTLTADRVKKGFTVVQTVLGFQPDTRPFDGQDANAGGSPWEKGFARINPAYFDECDLKIEWLVRSGIVPCILSGWGYDLIFMGEERMQLHWKYLVARYSAYPVIWCAAGETAMPFYLSKDGPKDSEFQKAAWTRIIRYIRKIDPFRRPLTTHPRQKSWEDITDPKVLDFQMLQVAHTAAVSCMLCFKFTEESRAKFPKVPVVNGEPPYEGHMGLNGPDVQRYAFWATMLSGAVGFTYGAAGIFQANDRARPAGHKPGGAAYDGDFWDEAIHFPGAAQLGRAKTLLAELPFQSFTPHPEWVTIGIRWGEEHYRPEFRAFCAGVPKVCRVVYIPARFYHWDGPLIKKLEPGIKYQAWYVNTVTGERIDLGAIKPDRNRSWQAPLMPFLHDWVLLMRKIIA
jgi:hypothetical protein